jgi:hypothetical protein
MCVTDQGQDVFLKGVGSMANTCIAISTVQSYAMIQQGSVVAGFQLFGIDTDMTEIAKDVILVGLQQILHKFADVFATPTGLPPKRSCDHRIDLIPGARPVNIRAYRHSPELKAEIEKQIAEMCASGIIRPSKSAFSSPIIVVKKKDGGWRICNDFRQLNSLTIPTKFPIPVIDELLDELFGATWFSRLDLHAGYHQIRLAEGEEHKTTFQTHNGQFEYRVMTFGLSGAPATFQSAMNDTLKQCLRRCAVVFFDDILIYSKNFQQHLIDVEEVLSLLRKDQWLVKESKCAFGQRKIAYLGHVISEQGVATDPSKIEEVENWKQPTNVKELRQFLGLAGYYRKFVQHSV